MRKNIFMATVLIAALIATISFVSIDNANATNLEKVCIGTSTENFWVNTFSVPGTWTKDNCRGYHFRTGANHYTLGCMKSDKINQGKAGTSSQPATVPNPNCGW